MRTRTRRTLAATVALTLAVSAAALASGPLKGKTYVGSAPATGISSRGHHRLALHAGGNITLKVAGNGRSVTVRFSSSSPVLYCNTTKALQVQSTKPAQILRLGDLPRVDQRAVRGRTGAAGDRAGGERQVLRAHRARHDQHTGRRMQRLRQLLGKRGVGRAG